MKRIAICAPATPLERELAQRVAALVAKDYPQLELSFHEQCFASEGHFAGSDAVRLAALLECANDPGFEAVWFAKGGYGSNRIVQRALAGLNEHAANKAYLGYSDCGTLLGALYRAGLGQQVHAPMPVDIKREGGEAAVRRALDWLSGNASGLEENIHSEPVVAFNLTTLAMLVGTEFMPELAGHVVMIEEVAEHLYAIDRMMFHITQHLQGIAGIRLGELTAVPQNDRPFGVDAVEIVEDWCQRSGISYLGRAQIGHSADNRIVPFGLVEPLLRA